jgi:hypothetical protein
MDFSVYWTNSADRQPCLHYNLTVPLLTMTWGGHAAVRGKIHETQAHSAP